MFTAPHSRAGSLGASDDRYRQIECFYAAQGARLLRRVAADVGDRALAEDGCQAAWAALLGDRRIACDAQGFAWLRLVATRAARRARRSREVAAGPMTGGGEGQWELEEPSGTQRGPLQHVLDAEALEEAWGQLRTLTVRERRLLALRGLGLSYAEIGVVTGDSVRTVERQLLRGRRKLRRQIVS
jgi:RNA polymerase sigma factor (sigma-70 family)